MAKPNNKTSVDTKDVNKEVSSEASVVDSTKGNETIASNSDSVKTSSRDVEAEAVEKFYDKEKTNTDSSKPASNFKKNNSRNDFKKGGGSSSKPNTSTNRPSKSSQNATSSVVTKTVVNELSHFGLSSTKDRLVTSGWIDRIDGLSIFDQLNKLFQELGINSAQLLSRRGDLLKNFSDWASLLKVRINKSSPVYVIDDLNADKGLSSETIFDNFYKQGRPFFQTYSGIPQIAARKLPSINHNIKVLNVSTNGHGPNLDDNFSKFASYGTIIQDLAQTNGYQTRKIFLDPAQNGNKGYISSVPHMIKYYRLPSNNHNGVAKRLSEFNLVDNNVLSTGNFNLFADNAPRIDGPINMSIELNNKAKFITKLFRIIQDEAVNYAKKQSSGDNAWFSPAYLIQDDKTLAATLNGLADLKTFLFIVNDAINGAAASQLVKATKSGTPDSTYIGIVNKSTYYKNEYASQFTKIWSAFTNIPMHKDVIDKWNQYKHWSKFNEKDLYDNDNMLMIPAFLIARSGGGYYHTDFVYKEYDKTTPDIKVLKPTQNQLFKALSVSVQTLDKSQYLIPQGDAFALFMQSIIANLSLSSQVRTGKSNTKFSFADNGLETGATSLLNGDKFHEKFIAAIEANLDESEGTLVVPQSGIVTQTNPDGTPATPLRIEGRPIEGSQAQHWSLPGLAGNKNVFGDIVVSYHTFTGFMASFMDMIVTGVSHGHLDAWLTYLQAINPFFARIAELAPKNDSMIFGDVIQPLAINNLPEPFTADIKHDINQNIDFYYQASTYDTKRDFSYTPTRVNFMSNAEFQRFSGYPYKAIGNRWTIINRDGKADRDVTRDNTLITLAGTATVKNYLNANTPNCSVYLVSWSVIRLSEFIQHSSTKGVGQNNQLFPIYLGAHAGEMFLNQTNIYTHGSSYPRVSNLNSRSLLVNSSDELYLTTIPGAFDFANSFNLLNNLSLFLSETGVLVPNVWYCLHKVIPATVFDTVYQTRIMSQYNNNGSVNITDYIVDTLFNRWSIDADYTPTTSFSTL